MSEVKKSKWALFLEGFKEGWQEETAGQQKRVSTEGVEVEDDFYLPFEDEDTEDPLTSIPYHPLIHGAYPELGQAIDIDSDKFF